MKKVLYIFIAMILTTTLGFSQSDEYNLSSRSLNKKVRKTIQHYYTYDKNSGGFVKKSVSINSYNDDGYLTESYYLYNGSYSDGSPTKKVYNYNSDNQIISINNLSPKKTKYSTDVKFIYNGKGHLTRKETIYPDGDKYVDQYQTDDKRRIVKKESYNKKNQLSSETDIRYNGSKRTEIRTGYNTKDGSINGTYTTVYKNDQSISYCIHYLKIDPCIN